MKASANDCNIANDCTIINSLRLSLRSATSPAQAPSTNTGPAGVGSVSEQSPSSAPVAEKPHGPVGLSAVTQLAVPRVMSLMMGTWFLATAFSETLAALFGKLAAIDVPEGEVMDIAAASAKYAHLFWLMMWIGLGCAVLAFIAAPLLRRMMQGVK